MKVEKLIQILQGMNYKSNIQFYLLKNYNLDSMELETIRNSDSVCEITVKAIFSDEGGNR
tara:strand:- start:3507 stop:3686 length:180 start_codon:yes stop_codon:yes gene_type:complete